MAVSLCVFRFLRHGPQNQLLAEGWNFFLDATRMPARIRHTYFTMYPTFSASCINKLSLETWPYWPAPR